MATTDFDQFGRALPTMADFEQEAANLAAAKRVAAKFKAERLADEAAQAAEIQRQRDNESELAAKAHRESYRRAWQGKPEDFSAAYAKVLNQQQVEQMTRQVEGTDQARVEQRARIIAEWGSPS